MAFDLNSNDIFHHALFVPVIGGIHFTYPWGCAGNVRESICFFRSHHSLQTHTHYRYFASSSQDYPEVLTTTCFLQSKLGKWQNSRKRESTVPSTHGYEDPESRRFACYVSCVTSNRIQEHHRNTLCLHGSFSRVVSSCSSTDNTMRNV